MVPITCPPLTLDDRAGSARALDLLARGLGEAVRAHGEPLGALPLAGADALLGVPRTGRRLEAVQADLLAHQRSTFTRWLTVAIAPRTVGSSGRSTLRPMRPSPSVRNVSRCFGFAPLAERSCVIRSLSSISRRLRGHRSRLGGLRGWRGVRWGRLSIGRLALLAGAV